MKTAVAKFVTTKKDQAVASSKEFAAAKAKETGIRTLNAVLEHPQVKKYDEIALNFIQNFAYDKLESLETKSKKGTAKTVKFIDKAAKAMMWTGITVASLGIIGGVVAAFATQNFFWLVLSTVFLIGLFAVVGTGIAALVAKPEGEVKTASVSIVETPEEVKVPALTSVLANLETKATAAVLPDTKIEPKPELKAA